ncbi:MAG: RDD family protein [Ignavibacteriales bacterium]
MQDNDFAGLGQRAAAFAFDILVLAIPCWVALSLEQTGLVCIILPMLYFTGFDGSKRQATMGKELLHIKVVDRDGNRISYWRALARTGTMILIPVAAAFFGFTWIAALTGNIVKADMLNDYIMALAFLIEWAFILFTPKKQALYDILSGCVVYRSDTHMEMHRPKGKIKKTPRKTHLRSVPKH